VIRVTATKYDLLHTFSTTLKSIGVDMQTALRRVRHVCANFRCSQPGLLHVAYLHGGGRKDLGILFGRQSMALAVSLSK
jgi:hypothetical protein